MMGRRRIRGEGSIHRLKRRSARSAGGIETESTRGFSHRPMGGALGALLTVGVASAPLIAQNGPPPPEPTAVAALDPLDDIDLLSLEVPVVVTASRRGQSLRTVPHAMSVVTAEDIRLSGARSIPDALRLVPGVDVAELTDGNAAVSPRGSHAFTSRNVLVLIDGRQIFDSFFGGSLWGSWPVQLEDIDRIEVIRGPGGVTWGANAVNGVINIITKDPDRQQGLRIKTTAGSRGAFSQYVGYGLREGKLRLRLSATYEGSDGFREGGSILRALDDEFRAARVGLHAVYDAGTNDKYSFWAGHATREDGFPATPLAGLGTGKNAFSMASFVKATWSHTIDDKNDFEWTVYVNDFAASPGLRAIDFRYQQIAVQFQKTSRQYEDHEFTWGLDTRVDLLDATNADPRATTDDFVSSVIAGLYAQDRWQFRKKWSATLGARVDYGSFGGFEPSARASIAYTPDDASLYYAAVSRAFQMPPAAFRFLRIPLLNGLASVVTDRDIRPQTLLAYELGYRGRIADRIDLGIHTFWHEEDDITPLEPQLSLRDLVRIDVDNRAQSSTYGVELDLTYPVTEKLTLLSNYTYQQQDWSSTAPRHLTDSMKAPKHKAMIGARYAPTDQWDLSAHLFFVDSSEAPNPANPFVVRGIDPYLRLDLRAEHKFGENASIAVGVRNLLDPDHREGGTLFLNDAEVPRMVYTELRVAIP